MSDLELCLLLSLNVPLVLLLSNTAVRFLLVFNRVSICLHCRTQGLKVLC